MAEKTRRRLLPSTRGRLNGRRSQRGAVAVEAALITPIFVLLVFGIIEFGLMFKDYLAVVSSVRAGARIASAEPRNINFATDAAAQIAREGAALDMTNVSELWVYKANKTTGTPVGYSDFSNCTTCVKFTWDTSSKTFVQKAGTNWLYTTQNACAGDPNHDSIGVYLKYRHPSVTSLIVKDFDLQSSTVMSFEPQPQTSPCK